MKKFLIGLSVLLGSLIPVGIAHASPSWMTQINNICGPVNVYHVSAAYKAKYCAVYAYPSGSYWVRYCAIYPDYCASL